MTLKVRKKSSGDQISPHRRLQKDNFRCSECGRKSLIERRQPPQISTKGGDISSLQLVLSSIKWPISISLSFIFLMSCYAILYVPLSWGVTVWTVTYYYLTGFALTAGYHRLFSHRSYKATFPLKLAYCLLGAGGVEGSAIWWTRLHRAHHRYTDTERDPYNAVRGFFYSHMGWMLLNEDRSYVRTVDMADLKNDKLTALQHRFYIPLAFFMAFIFPAIISWGLFGDFWGGLFWAGFVRTCFLQQATYCVNSAAHIFGESTFDDVLTPRDSSLVSLVTFGEGYHNFHHEFPNDYRNAICWWQYDPTKWLIYGLSLVGLAYDLKRFSENEIQKGKLQMEQAKMNRRKAKLKWGNAPSELPIWSMEKLQNVIRGDSGRILIAVNSVIHDVTEFHMHHPGGEDYFRAFNGKDATEAFNGGVYNHTNAARNLLSQWRVATLRTGTK